jgi:hypothetical protein
MRSDLAKRTQFLFAIRRTYCFDVGIPGQPAGIEFIEENGGGPGVRLRKLPKQKR